MQRLNRIIKFNDEEVDKFFIAGLSPYVIFRNTRSDLGLWEKITDDDAKEVWDALPQDKKAPPLLYPPTHPPCPHPPP